MNDNGKKGQLPPVAPIPQITPEDIQTQVGVILTKKSGMAMMFPQTPEGAPDIPLALELLAIGLNTLAQIIRQMAPQDTKRIVVVPGLPPGVDLRGEAGK